jgi:starch synthase
MTTRQLPPAVGVIHLTAEYWPYARTGGLGQAVAGLAAEQARGGLPTTVVLPLYAVAREAAGTLKPFGEPFEVELGPRRELVRLWQRPGPKRGVRLLFLEHAAYFDRPGIYGDGGADYADNHLRFGCFCAAVVEALPRLVSGEGWVLHAHDWHTALAPVFLRTRYAGRDGRDRVAAVVSVHNGGFQGHFGRDVLGELGLPDELWAIDRMEWYGRLNYLKGGLVFADMCTTVSPTHAIELRTEVGGFGLHDQFIELHDRLVGIRNGIDHHEWDPQRDPHLPAAFSADDLRGKVTCKAALQEAWGLPVRPDTPVFGMSARLVAQKGLDIILGGASLVRGDAQYVFLGSGEARYEQGLAALAASHPDRVGVNFQFTDAVEHRLLGGADFLLMPSLYEPCGLTQMRAQRYGALPIARRVGGLADTIEDEVTGFLFDEYTPAGFDRAVRRALAVFHDRPRWLERAEEAMRRDFSWTQSVQRYAEVYRRARAAR